MFAFCILFFEHVKHTLRQAGKAFDTRWRLLPSTFRIQGSTVRPSRRLTRGGTMANKGLHTIGIHTEGRTRETSMENRHSKAKKGCDDAAPSESQSCMVGRRLSEKAERRRKSQRKEERECPWERECAKARELGSVVPSVLMRDGGRARRATSGHLRQAGRRKASRRQAQWQAAPRRGWTPWRRPTWWSPSWSQSCHQWPKRASPRRPWSR